jgi:ankyrin repeat protein
MRLHLSVPDWYYRISIDRIIAPWHAYLQRYCPQQSGSALRGDELTAFLDVCRTGSKDAFLQLCREWNDNEETATSVHTPDNLDRFLTTFRCGLLPACRNVLNTARIPPAEMVALLVTHGANFLQKDDKRISGLHWAAATRNAGGLEVLLISWCQERYPDETCYSAAAKLVLQEVVTGKDGATVLHWAACGVGRNWIGTGGSTEICHYLLELVGSDPAVVDATTRNTGATPFMWAAWSGSIDAARLLVEEGGANARHVNSQGQTAAHWAAAAGQLEMFRYLVEELGLESDQADHSGETPLDYAKQYHQDSILDWCKRHLEDRQISPPRNEGSMRI